MGFPFRRYDYRRYAYLGIPPQEKVVYYEYGRTPKEVIVTDDLYDYLPYLRAYEPQPNYALDDQIINQITYRIMTNIFQYKPKKQIEISPVTKVRFNLG
jgi:hypothetical protein